MSSWSDDDLRTISENDDLFDLYDKTDLIPFDKLGAFFTENLAGEARITEELAASVA